MKPLVTLPHYNGNKDYEISIIEDNNGDLITTIYEVQPDRKPAVFRRNTGKQKDAEILIAETKELTLIFPHLIPPI